MRQQAYHKLDLKHGSALAHVLANILKHSVPDAQKFSVSVYDPCWNRPNHHSPSERLRRNIFPLCRRVAVVWSTSHAKFHRDMYQIRSILLRPGLSARGHTMYRSDSLSASIARPGSASTPRPTHRFRDSRLRPVNAPPASQVAQAGAQPAGLTFGRLVKRAQNGFARVPPTDPTACKCKKTKKLFAPK
jgi:hypothetical protein